MEQLRLDELLEPKELRVELTTVYKVYDDREWGRSYGYYKEKWEAQAVKEKYSSRDNNLVIEKTFLHIIVD